MQHMRSAGLYTGGKCRFGYAVGPNGASLVEDPAEQAVLAQVRALREHHTLRG